MLKTVALSTMLVQLALGDVYMHNPRGGNNRLNEPNRNRQNDNRLFDSQNNGAGGYGIGTNRMYYFEGSWLTIEWTAQHSCGQGNAHCEIILQYMCQTKDAGDDVNIRDGTTTTTIKDDATYADKTPGGTDYVYGMHEPQSYYAECKVRERNKGLFIADRNKGDKATSTRQQNNGRFGFECPEERDYYPYWHPSPWRDIAVLTTDTSMCSYYRKESQNMKDKGHCVADTGVEADMTKAWQFNNEAACITSGYKWMVDGAHKIARPECLEAPWSRDNHLGSGASGTLTGFLNHYNWTLPRESELPCIKEDNCVCVLRMRYNISVHDYQGKPTKDDMADSSDNTKEESVALILDDPTVDVSGVDLELALNTEQTGRTFQDRSHTFEIRPRPTQLKFAQRIFNLNVRGKRGNIVQAYPALEYDFVPQHLIVRQYDYVHFQWTGFDNNPNNNDGEGTQGTDRSNIVQTAGPGYNYPLKDDAKSLDKLKGSLLFEDKRDRNKFAGLLQDGCLDYEELLAQNNNNENQVEQDPKNCMKLNAASAYFDGGVYRQNTTGDKYYISTRNNNFSNRSQKGTLTVMPILPAWSIAVAAVGGVAVLGSVAAGAMMLHAKKNPMSRFANWASRV